MRPRLVSGLDLWTSALRDLREHLGARRQILLGPEAEGMPHVLQYIEIPRLGYIACVAVLC